MRYVQPFTEDRYADDDPFGNIRPSTGRPHLGSDYPAPAGTPIRSIGSGTVIVNQWSDVLGNVLGVVLDDGLYAGYAHLLSPAAVPVGSALELAQPDIARVGNTGSASNGNHLHLSLGTTSGAIFGEGYGSTLLDPFAVIAANSTPEDTDMKIIEFSYIAAKHAFLIEKGYLEHIADGRDLAGSEKVTGPKVSLSQAEAQQVLNVFLRGAGLKTGDIEARAKLEPGFIIDRRATAGDIEIDYAELAKALKAEGVFELVIAGTARPAK